jgi:hypothetical protein
MRVLGYHRRKRRADLENLTEVEAALAELVRLLEPLPATRSGPGTGSTPPAAT